MVVIVGVVHALVHDLSHPVCAQFCSSRGLSLLDLLLLVLESVMVALEVWIVVQLCLLRLLSLHGLALFKKRLLLLSDFDLNLLHLYVLLVAQLLILHLQFHFHFGILLRLKPFDRSHQLLQPLLLQLQLSEQSIGAHDHGFLLNLIHLLGYLLFELIDFCTQSFFLIWNV